jgi:hypothetical protein
LLAAQLGVGICLKRGYTPCQEGTHPKPQAFAPELLENINLLAAGLLDFVESNSLITPYSSAHTLPRPESEAVAELRAAIRYAKDKGNLVRPPLRQRKGELLTLAANNTREDFRTAVRECVAQHPWTEYDRDPWAYFCDNFEMYLQESKERQRREQAKAKRREQEPAQPAREEFTEEQKHFYKSKQQLHAAFIKCIDEVTQKEFNDKAAYLRQLETLLEFLPGMTTQKGLDDLAEGLEQVRAMISNEGEGPAEDFLLAE